MPDIIHPTMPFSTIAFLHEQWERMTESSRRMWSKHCLVEFDTVYFHKVLIDARLLDRYLAMKLLSSGDSGFDFSH